MSRPALRILCALLALSAAACASPTAPTPYRARFVTPRAEAAFDDVTTTDSTTTCRSGYIDPQGRTC